MKKILWISRHRPLPSQRRELSLLAGDKIKFIHDANTFLDAADIAQGIKATVCDDVVIVAPLSVLNKLCELGVHPLVAEMRCEKRGGSERVYTHIRFRRLTGIEMHWEEV